MIVSIISTKNNKKNKPDNIRVSNKTLTYKLKRIQIKIQISFQYELRLIIKC